MIGILKNLRKNLFKGNKVSRYLLYALGEIILIVLGILLALGINNWSEDTKLVNKEQFYLSGLKDEFETSKARLEVLIDVNRSNYQNAEAIANFISSQNVPEEAELSMLLYKAFSYDVVYNPNNALLDEILNSGGFKTISNPELRKHLTSWQSRVQRINSQERALIGERDNVINVFRKEGSIRTVFIKAGISEEINLSSSGDLLSNSVILSSKEFENNLLLFILTSVSTEKHHYIPLMEEIDKILKLIESDLKG